MRPVEWPAALAESVLSDGGSSLLRASTSTAELRSSAPPGSSGGGMSLLEWREAAICGIATDGPSANLLPDLLPSGQRASQSLCIAWIVCVRGPPPSDGSEQPRILGGQHEGWVAVSAGVHGEPSLGCEDRLEARCNALGMEMGSGEGGESGGDARIGGVAGEQSAWDWIQ